LEYPDKDPSLEKQEQFYNFFNSLGGVLPCVVCSEGYIKDFTENQPILTDRQSLLIWLTDFHKKSNPKTNIECPKNLLKKYVTKSIYKKYSKSTPCTCDK
jgi:hypothetical protein